VAGVLFLLSEIASEIGEALGVGARLAKIPSVAKFIEEFRKARANLKGGGEPDAKPTDTDPNVKKPEPSEVVICRACFKVKIPSDLELERNALSQEGQNLFDQKLSNLVRDPAAPTEVEFQRMRDVIKSLKTRFGDLENGLKADATKPGAKPPFGEGVGELPRLRKQAVDLLADIEDFIKEDPQGRRGLRDSAARVQADINGVLTKMEQGQLEATNARIEGFDNNLKGVRREL
jgi:hypothetical protein